MSRFLPGQGSAANIPDEKREPAPRTLPPAGDYEKNCHIAKKRLTSALVLPKFTAVGRS